MAETQPMNLQALCYTADEDREALAALVCGEGVVDKRGGDLLVASTGSGDHSVTIAAGSAYVSNNDATGESQMYRVTNDGSVTVQLAAGGGGDSRVDTIVATVRDSEYGGSDDDWVLDSVDGTPSPSAALSDAGIAASAAAVPDNSVVLAYVLVAGADTLSTTISAGNILDARNNYTKCGAAPEVELFAAAATGPLVTNTPTKVNLATTQRLDRDSFSVAASVVTIKEAGLYDISAYAGMTGTNFTAGTVAIAWNGTTISLAQTLGTPTNGFWRASTHTLAWQLAASDTIQLLVTATHTGTVNTEHDVVTGKVSRLFIRKVG